MYVEDMTTLFSYGKMKLYKEIWRRKKNESRTKDTKNAVTRMISLYKKEGGDVTFVLYSHNFHRSLNTSIQRVIKMIHPFHCPVI